jgi:hypothetical protein
MSQFRHPIYEDTEGWPTGPGRLCGEPMVLPAVSALGGGRGLQYWGNLPRPVLATPIQVRRSSPSTWLSGLGDLTKF